MLAAGRHARGGTYYGIHYTFTLAAAAQVTIDVASDDQDAYL